MRRLHVISTPEHEMGGEIYYREHEFAHDPELHRAYKCGVKQGWREAMKETYGDHYAERHYGRVGVPPMYREEYPIHHETPMYRDHDRSWDDDEVVYRRGRDARGRYM